MCENALRDPCSGISCSALQHSDLLKDYVFASEFETLAGALLVACMAHEL